MPPNDLPTWAAPDVIVDDLHALADHHHRLGISRRDARALRRVAARISAIDDTAGEEHAAS